VAAIVVSWSPLFLLTPGSSNYFGISIFILPPLIVTIHFYRMLPACNSSLFRPLSQPSGGVVVGGVSHMLKRLDDMIGQKFNPPMPRIDIFVIALTAPLLEKSLIIQRHIGQRGRTMSMIIQSRSVVLLCCGSPPARPKTLISVDFGTKSTHKHAHMVKINSSHVKILQSFYKVPTKFPQLRLQRILNC
jgi:hypothetical protein